MNCNYENCNSNVLTPVNSSLSTHGRSPCDWTLSIKNCIFDFKQAQKLFEEIWFNFLGFQIFLRPQYFGIIWGRSKKIIDWKIEAYFMIQPLYWINDDQPQFWLIQIMLKSIRTAQIASFLAMDSIISKFLKNFSKS